jgi:hypothetical protein
MAFANSQPLESGGDGGLFFSCFIEEVPIAVQFPGQEKGVPGSEYLPQTKGLLVAGARFLEVSCSLVHQSQIDQAFRTIRAVRASLITLEPVLKKSLCLVQSFGSEELPQVLDVWWRTGIFPSMCGQDKKENEKQENCQEASFDASLVKSWQGFKRLHASSQFPTVLLCFPRRKLSYLSRIKTHLANLHPDPKGVPMKYRLSILLLCILVLQALSVELLLGLTDSGELLLLDPVTGTGEHFAQMPYSNCEALASDPEGHLYAIVEGDDLARFDPDTGNSWIEGDTGSYCPVEALAWGPGGLFASADLSCEGTSELLISIDPNTGSGTTIGPYSEGWADVDGLSFTPEGLLLGSVTGPTAANCAFIMIDPNTAQTLYLSTLGVPLVGLDYSQEGLLFGISRPLDQASPQILVTIDPATGLLSEVGPVGYEGLVGLAFMTIPTASEDCSWSMLKWRY